MPRFSGIVSCAPCPLLLACLQLLPAEHDVQNVRGHDQSSGARPLSEGGCIVMKAGSLDEPATVRAASDSTLASAPTLGRPRRWSPSTRFPRKTLLQNLTSIRGAKLHAQVTRSPATTLNLPCLHGGDCNFISQTSSNSGSFHKCGVRESSSSFSLPSSSSPRVPWPRPRKPRRRGRTKCCCKCSSLLAPRAPLHEPAFAVTRMDCRLALAVTSAC
jgi:hypothetical protein